MSDEEAQVTGGEQEEINIWIGSDFEDDDRPSIRWYDEEKFASFADFEGNKLGKLKTIGATVDGYIRVSLKDFAKAARIASEGADQIFIIAYASAKAASLLKRCGAKPVESPHDGLCFVSRNREFNLFAERLFS